MASKCVGRCGAYKNRPKFCADYPLPESFLPPSCTFYFDGDQRKGECRPDVCLDNNCCNYPREGGEPEGKSLDELAGGLPCKHLVWVEIEETPKLASNEEYPSITSEIYEALMPSIRGPNVY
jgi:hypothetical protein